MLHLWKQTLPCCAFSLDGLVLVYFLGLFCFGWFLWFLFGCLGFFWGGKCIFLPSWVVFIPSAGFAPFSWSPSAFSQVGMIAPSLVQLLGGNWELIKLSSFFLVLRNPVFLMLEREQQKKEQSELYCVIFLVLHLLVGGYFLPNPILLWGHPLISGLFLCPIVSYHFRYFQNPGEAKHMREAFFKCIETTWFARTAVSFLCLWTNSFFSHISNTPFYSQAEAVN